MIVDPTCVRDRDSEKDEANAHKKDVTARVAAVLDDQGVVSLDNKDRLDDGSGPLPLYPSRPHGSFNEYVFFQKRDTCTDSMSVLLICSSYILMASSRRSTLANSPL